MADFTPQQQDQVDAWQKILGAHQVDALSQSKINSLRVAAMALSEAYIMFIPLGREQSLALSHLQDSLMHANAGIAQASKEPDNQSEDSGKES